MTVVRRRRPDLNIYVPGKAAPQGSKTRTRFALIEDNPRTRPWRAYVTDAAKEAMRDARWAKLMGPVTAILVFDFARPKSHKLDSQPITKSTYDLDKLQRAIFDGLKVAGVYNDDAQVTLVVATKRYLPFGADEGVQIIISQGR